MARRKLSNKLIKEFDIKEKLGTIKNSIVDFITPTGQVYCYYGKDINNNKLFFKKSVFMNKSNKYMYVSLRGIERQFQRRVHILIAEAFIPNDDKNKNIVMHIDNNKQNNNIENLKWGTVSENTQQAYDDGLCVNDKGFNDSQSKPIIQFDKDKNIIKTFGSITLATEQLKINSKFIISNQVNHKNNELYNNYYFRFLNEYKLKGFVL